MQTSVSDIVSDDCITQ